MPLSPTELAALVRTDPQVQQALRRLIAGFTSDLAEGRVPGQGAGQNDTFDDRDNVDPTHPMNLSYFLPTNNQRLVRAVLSWRLHPFRTYNTFSSSQTGDTTPTSDATGESGHTHSHGHTITVNSGAPGAAIVIGWDATATAWQANVAGPTTGPLTNTNAQASSGHSHSHNHGAHHHSLAIASTLGIFEGASATNITLAFDAVDRTAALGGPFNADQIELEITKFIDQKTPGWHTIQLGSATLGQIEAKLRLSFYSNSAQGG